MIGTQVTTKGEEAEKYPTRDKHEVNSAQQLASRGFQSSDCLDVPTMNKRRQGIYDHYKKLNLD